MKAVHGEEVRAVQEGGEVVHEGDVVLTAVAFQPYVELTDPAEFPISIPGGGERAGDDTGPPCFLGGGDEGLKVLLQPLRLLELDVVCSDVDDEG